MIDYYFNLALTYVHHTVGDLVIVAVLPVLVTAILATLLQRYL